MPENEGWILFPQGRKWHYIQTDGHSLCGRWFMLRKGVHLEPDDGEAPDDCAECRRRLNKRNTAKEAE